MRLRAWVSILAVGAILAAHAVAPHGTARLPPGAATPASSTATAGAVNFFARTSSSNSSYLNNPTAARKSWIGRRFWHALTYSPFFDSRTSWYPKAWVYKDLFAIYKGSAFAKEHESWILRNAAGKLLYIPWSCANGTCPQYAGDVASPAFRHAWIAEAKAEIAKGYSGIWIDDVDLVYAVGNGSGTDEPPIDPNTGKLMTEQAWQEYVTTFVEEIEHALPESEIVHNSVWFAGGAQRWKNPLVKREIAAADYINLERGVNDPNMAGGTGEWSLSTFLSFVDAVHAQGKGVIFDSYDNGSQEREYNLAAYLLVSTGNDAVGDAEITPEKWWSGFQTNLGAASGERTTWQGLMRRDFTGGIVLVNEPQAPTRTVTLPHQMRTTGGALVTSVTLPPASGAVLRYQSTP
jgi:hypothetical protein